MRYIAIALGMLVVGLVVALLRRGSVGGTTIGSRRLELHSPADPMTVYARLTQIGGKYTVDAADPAGKIVVLSSRPTFATWGFFYPIRIHASGSGSRIEIGIRSRFLQLGPMVTRDHNQCLEAVAQLLGLPEARVA